MIADHRSCDTDSPVAGGVAHLWWANLDEIRSETGLLSPDEADRADRFRSPQLRTRYVAGRCWLRRVLAGETGTPPADIRFRYVGLGKPMLDNPRNARSFSLAHSGRFALLGIGLDGALGVDLERIARGVYDPAVAGIVLSPDELDVIEAAADRDRAFLRCWVRKEAYAKIDGRGMDRHLASVTLTGPSGTGLESSIVLDDVTVPEDVIAAVAHDRNTVVVNRGEWQDGLAA